MADPKRPLSFKMRVLHRYLGFFLAGIMAVYALSGVVLIYRKTDFLKREVTVEKQVAANLPAPELGKAIGVRNLAVIRSNAGTDYFKNGSYDRTTGLAIYTKKELPYVLKQMTHLHKATTNDPLYYLNLFFGFGLLFFVISAFWMYAPGGPILRKGLVFAAAGLLLTLALLFI